MPPKDDKSYIEELDKSLYSRNAPDVRTKRKLRFSDDASLVKTDWAHEAAEDAPPKELNQVYKNPKMSFLSKLLIGSAIFCVISVGIGAFLFFNGANLISANNIEIKIDGPVSIAGGEPATFDLTINNNNNVPLVLADLRVDFPAGTTDPENAGAALQNKTKLIGDVPAGGFARESVKAAMFGEENQKKEIIATLTYGVRGSSAVFTKTQTFEVLLTSSPITININSFKEITSGQEFDMTVLLKSNSDQVLKNVILKAAYPFGYTLISSKPASQANTSTWKVGDLPAGAQRSIVLRGKLIGEDTDPKAFHFTVGSAATNNSNNIGTQYLEVEQELTIRKPFISLNVSIDGDSGEGDYVGEFNQSQRVEIIWFNNLSVAVSNVTITAKLSGTAYDKTAVDPDDGYFDSAANTIRWSPQTTSSLRSIGPGEDGKVTFSITPKNLGGSNATNPNISFDVSINGQRPQEVNVPQNINAAITRNVRISSSLDLSGRIVRSIGPFGNTGPIPPKAENETTYTIIWNIDNASNSVTNAEVVATLPAYVRYIGNISPSSEHLVYDKNTGKITWDVGSVSANTINSSRRREVAFQVALKPSISQVGQVPSIISQAVLKAIDGFTGSDLESIQDQLTTRFSTDPNYREGDEVVVN